MPGWTAWTRDDWRALEAHAGQLRAPVADLALVIDMECRGNPAAVYWDGDFPVAVGLNQITRPNAQAMGIGEEERRAIPSLPIREQLPYVVRSFHAAMGGARAYRDTGELYQANFAPGILRARGSADSLVLYSDAANPTAYKHNKGLDVDHDGAITMRDIRQKLRARASSPDFRAALERLNQAVPGAGSPRIGVSRWWHWLIPAGAVVGGLAAAWWIEGRS